MSVRRWLPLLPLLIPGCKPVLSDPGVVADTSDGDADTDTDTDADTDTDVDTDTACTYTDGESGGAESFTDAGVVCLPATFRGDLYSVGHDDENQYTGDYDFMRFQVPTSAEFFFDLDWEAAGSDYDLYVYKANDVTLIASADDQTAQPEEVAVSLNAGVYYYIAVVGYDGSPGDWWVKLER